MALRTERLMRSDAFVGWLAQRVPGLSRLLETLFDLIGLTLVAILLQAHWPILAKSWSRNEFVGSIGSFTVPTWPAKLLLFAGLGLLFLQFAARILRRWTAEESS